MNSYPHDSIEEFSLNKMKIKLATCEDLENLDFDCGDDDLNEFISIDYKNNLVENLCVIYLCVYNNEIVGFFALSTDSIKFKDDDEFKTIYPYYPAIKIGRIGVSKNYQKKGIGGQIINWVVGLCLKKRNCFGIRFISVDAYSDAKKFYENNYFIESDINKSKTIVYMARDLNMKF